MLTNPQGNYVIDSTKEQVLLAMFLLQYQIGPVNV